MTSTATPIAPSPADWLAARMAALDPELIRRMGESPRPEAKAPADLVPGDDFVSRGAVLTVTDFPRPHTNPDGVGLVEIPTLQAGVVTHVAPSTVVSWRSRRVNYGRVRCGSCWTNVGRDHGPAEGLELQRERAHKRNGDW